MESFKPISMITNEIAHSSLLGSEAALNCQETDDSFQDSDFISFILEFFKRETVEQRIGLIMENEEYLLSRPSREFPESQEINDFLFYFLEMFQAKSCFSELITIFTKLFVLNTTCNIDGILHGGLIDFFSDVFPVADLEEKSGIISTMRCIANRNDMYRIGILSDFPLPALYEASKEDSLVAEIADLLFQFILIKKGNEKTQEVFDITIAMLKNELPPDNLFFSDRDSSSKGKITKIFNTSEVASLLRIIIFAPKKVSNFFDVMCSEDMTQIINFILMNEYSGEILKLTLILIIKVLEASKSKVSEVKDPFELFNSIPKPVTNIPFNFEIIPKLIHTTTSETSITGRLMPCFACKIISMIQRLKIQTNISNNTMHVNVIPSLADLIENGTTNQRVYSLKAIRAIFECAPKDFQEHILALELTEKCFEQFDSDCDKLILESLKLLNTLVDFAVNTGDLEIITKDMDESKEEQIDELIDSSNPDISAAADYFKEHLTAEDD